MVQLPRRILDFYSTLRWLRREESWAEGDGSKVCIQFVHNRGGIEMVVGSGLMYDRIRSSSTSIILCSIDCGAIRTIARC